MRNIVFPFAILALVGCSRPVGDVGKHDRIESELKRLPAEFQDSPEAALRKFLIATAFVDKESLNEVVLPHPEIDLLVSPVKLPPEAEAEIRKLIENTEIVAVKVGDEMFLPNGKTIKVDESHVNSNRQMLRISHEAFDLVLSDGRWRVNPEPLIARTKESGTHQAFAPEAETKKLEGMIREMRENLLKSEWADEIWPMQEGMVPSGYESIPEAKQLDELFGPAWHACANYEKPDTVEWISQTYVAQRYELEMRVRIRIERPSGKFVEQTESPRFYLRRIEKVEDDGYGTAYDPAAERNFGTDDWRKIVQSNGDLSVLGIDLKNESPVKGFDQLIKVPRNGIQFLKQEN